VLTIHGNAKGLCTGITRRDLLSAGSLGVGGVSLDHLLRLDSLQAKGLALNAGKAKSCIVLFLYGAWSQLDTLDMKPAAPREVRGEFQPISTSVPGIQISEHLPRLARRLYRLSLVRSMTPRTALRTRCLVFRISRCGTQRTNGHFLDQHSTIFEINLRMTARVPACLATCACLGN